MFLCLVATQTINQANIQSTQTFKQAKGTTKNQKNHTINQIKQSAKKENKQTRRRNLILKISNSRSTAPGGCYVSFEL
jgi:hypothetical protein